MTSRQACYDAAADGVRNLGEQDGYGASLLLNRRQNERRADYDHLWLQPNKFDCSVSYAVAIGSEPAILNPDVFPVRPAECLKATLERVSAPLCFFVSFLERHHRPDKICVFSRLLRARRERPRGRPATEECDELAPSDVEQVLPPSQKQCHATAH